MKLLPSTWFLCRKGCRCVIDFVVWTVWLLLVVVLIFQLRIIFSRQVAVPEWMLHKMENRHIAHGISSKIGSAVIDPSGRLLLGEVHVSSAKYGRSLLVIRRLEATLNPWAGLAGDFGAARLDLRDAELHLPAMLSPSGEAQAVLTDVDLGLSFNEREITVDRLSGRCGKLIFSARGTFIIPRREGDSGLNPAQIIEGILAGYVKIAQRIAERAPLIETLDSPYLSVAFSPHPTHAALIRARIIAGGAQIPRDLLPNSAALPDKITLGPFAARATLPALAAQSWASRIQISATAIDAGEKFATHHVDASLLAQLLPGWKWQPRSLDLSVGPTAIRDLRLSAAFARAHRQQDRVDAQIAARLFSEDWTAQLEADPSARSGTVELNSRLSRDLLAYAGTRAKRDLVRLLRPASPAPFSLSATFDPGWRLASASARVVSGPVGVEDVELDGAAGELFLRGTELNVENIRLLAGDSEARGSYSMDTQSREFRFLLHGRLRPPAIAGWFGPWWNSFWEHFDFSAGEPPRANVEVAGRWGRPFDTRVFVYAAANNAAINNVPLDYVRTRLFVRPGFFDGLEVVARKGEGVAQGTFTRSQDVRQHALNYQTFDVVGDVDPHEAARIFDPIGSKIVAPFVFERPPSLTIQGRITGAASPEGAGYEARVKINSPAPLRFFEFPLSHLTATAVVNNDEITVDPLRVGFAGGIAQGRARLTGEGEQRRLGFDAALDNASLGEAIYRLEEFGARRRGEAPPERSRLQEKLASGRLGVRLSGDGNADDPYSFIGSGSGEVVGAELAEIKLLGGLSDALRAVRLNFASLRLTDAQANFKLLRNQLDFPEFKISGPTAVLDLTGRYRLDLHMMDFNAKLSPYELSRNPLANAVDFVLTPFSNILELKLTGSLDQPQWRFTYGLSSFFRSLSGKHDEFEQETSTDPARNQPPPLLRRRQ